MSRTFTMTSQLVTLLMLSPALGATTLAADYKAIYDVIRGGKVMAERTTTFKSISENNFQLTDVTKGTKGLASLSGFQRTETTNFQIDGERTTEIEHEMQQKVVFSSKSYQFKAPAHSNTISGQSKKDTFTLQSNEKPISAHLMPLWLSWRACHLENPMPQSIQVPVLKSKHIKTYQFSMVADSEQLIRADRIYPDSTRRSSQIWFDKSRNCLPVKTRHSEKNEPVIETRLVSHLLTKNRTNN